MPVIRKSDVKSVTGSSYPAPFDEGMGRYRALPLSDAGGLTQFGAFLETLDPGARSSQRHWHEAEDEFLYLLEGQLTVIENDGAHVLQPGDAAAWKAGDQNAHCLWNHTEAPATYIVVGTRAPRDVCHYPEIDLVYSRENGVSLFTRRDGTPYPKKPETGDDR